MDQDVDGVAFNFVAPPVNALFDLRARENAPRPFDQRVHQGVFPRRKHLHYASARQLMRLSVEFRPAGDQQRCGPPRTAAHQRLHPRLQFAHLEGLYEIVVRAKIEAGHPIVEPVARRNDEHRRVCALPPRRLQQVEPVSAGEPADRAARSSSCCRAT